MPHDRLVSFLRALVDAGGSDLHVKAGSPPRVRVHGTLGAIEDQAVPEAAEVDDMAAAIMAPEVADRLERSGDTDFALSVPGVGRFRVNAFRQRGTTAMIFRHVADATVSFDELGLPDVVRRLADEHRGLLLVTGPTGSGKTTTLAAMIDHINRTRPVHIITIEDPIEVLHADQHGSIAQREIGVDADDFASAMRAAMRQDPDVILVGEMRDEETVSAALKAAETGHLVLSTLHTIDATETINRIVDFFPPHQHHQIRVALAGALRGTVCQRLVSTATGSSSGRVPAVEVMVTNGRIQQCIIDPASGEIAEIIADGEYYGMQTFDQALARLYGEGRIDLGGAMAAATKPHDLKVMLQRLGLVGTRANGADSRRAAV